MKPIQFVLLLCCASLCVSQSDAQWVQIGLSNRGISKVAVGSSGLFAITNDSGSVFRSTDGGANWVQVVQTGGQHIAGAPNGTIFVSRQDSLFRSTDRGDSWTWLGIPRETMTPGWLWWTINSVAVGPSGYVFCGRTNFSYYGMGAGGHHDSLEMSTDNGLTWAPCEVCAGRAFAFASNLAVSLGEWCATGTDGSGGGGTTFGISRDGGLRWEEQPNPGFDSPIVWCSNGNLMAQASGIVLSADTAATWSHISTVVPTALLAPPQGGVLVGTDTTGIYLFTDNGDSLGTLNDGLTDLHIHALALDSSGYVYVGADNGIWRRAVLQIVSVKEPLTNIPASFTLEQNYPNPFNPSTTIRYGLPQRSHVTLNVFNTLGQQVATLVQGEQEAGYHEAVFDASGLASGVYLYRLQAGDFVQAKKLIVVK